MCGTSAARAHQTRSTLRNTLPGQSITEVDLSQTAAGLNAKLQCIRSCQGDKLSVLLSHDFVIGWQAGCGVWRGEQAVHRVGHRAGVASAWRSTRVYAS